MRNVLLSATLLLTLATVAHADVTEPTTELTTTAVGPVTAAPHGYVESGVMAGGNNDLLTIGATIDAGFHLDHTPFWIHARVAGGAGDKLFGVGTGSLFQVRAGVESRSCAFDGVVCAMAGVDLGLQHTTWTGHDESWFSDSTPPDMTTTIDRFVAVPRVGLDIGGRVRFRPSLEADIDGQGVSGANLDLALAVQW
jgi:hypothetical protein